MTADGYENEDRAHDVRVLTDLRASVRSIDRKVEEILDELKEHLPELSGSGNGWYDRDFYDPDGYEGF